MKRYTLDCDLCPAKDVERCLTLSAVVDRQMDAAGSMDDVCDRLDLCPQCANRVLQHMLKKMDKGQAKDFFQDIRTSFKKKK